LTQISDAEFLFLGKNEHVVHNKFKNATVGEKLGHIKELLQKKGFDCFLADITTSIAKEFGVTIFRALIPNIYPLYLNETRKYLGIRRLFEVPVKMGILMKPKSEGEMNQIPHPML
jgi:hypothetical protein